MPPAEAVWGSSVFVDALRPAERNWVALTRRHPAAILAVETPLKCGNPASENQIRQRRRASVRGSATGFFLSSSMAEHPAVNRRVVGSNPT